jgi:hypothetical protein
MQYKFDKSQGLSISEIFPPPSRGIIDITWGKNLKKVYDTKLKCKTKKKKRKDNGRGEIGKGKINVVKAKNVI